MSHERPLKADNYSENRSKIGEYIAEIFQNWEKNGGEMAESTKVLALLLEVGLLQVRILVAAKG